MLTKEVVLMREITPVPGTETYVEGIMNLRGSLVPVIDFRKRLRARSMATPVDQRIIIVLLEGRSAGLIVDGASEVIRVSDDLIEDVPDLEAAVVPLSGGGLAGGIALAVKAIKPAVRVIGVSIERGAAMQASLAAGHPVEVEEVASLADSLGDSLRAPTPTLIEIYNRFNARVWDDIRDFLAVHYKFNTRLDTPFWRACRADTQLHGAEPMVKFYQENGPSLLSSQLLHPSNSFGMHGYLSLLVGQGLAHEKVHTPAPRELETWRGRCRIWELEAERALDVRECLQAIRQPGWKWE